MKKMALASLVAVAMVGCGGSSGSGGSAADTKTGRLDGQVANISHSSKTLNVNGYALRSDGAPVMYRDGVELPFDQLVNGMRVQIDADNNQIETMKLDPSLTGMVSAINGDTFTVNGITMTFAGLTGINVGDWVMVTTYPLADGSVEVVAVQKVPALGFVEIEGPVSQLDTHTFKVGMVTVDYSNADVDDRDELGNGAWVEVYGAYNTDTKTLLATEVDVEDDHDYDDTEIEGVISWVNNSLTQIELNGRLRIEVNNNTEFDDGRREDLASGRWVEVEMVLRSGRLVATEIEFEDGGDSIKGKEFQAVGEAKYQDGVFTINDIEIELNGQTEFDDGLNHDNLDTSWVEVEGRYLKDASGTGRYVAIEIEREDRFDDDIELEGPVINGTIWGYEATDSSLIKYEGRWVDLDCDFNGTYLSRCDD
ncbi:DUF5666 domain-containing protein [Photobacterium lutimaris]|uniref:DUF5666 domain-containing protein n=1 Tax=Photobacterium lutimaris TaxID=388278 RepID=A0A2T3IXN2_9GAMM|nr:DUF5666 domain-containing protein [Photobacterium lutimaris]PSU33295.1 hypothetical protein C9I99_13990 [Photobacterium lutimaris]TDR75114.1 hypothetical protein DFP78_105131 [Photobacterium lutimaris]